MASTRMAVVIAWAGWAMGSAAFGQVLGSVPKDLEEVGIVDKSGAQAPLELPFVDSDGRELRLGDVFDDKRPVLLTLNYSTCPMLCSLQLTGLFDALAQMPWNLGENFQMVTVSIDSTETPQRAQLTKQKYLKMYGRAGVADGWRCLTGKEADIRRLANTVGFHYKYLPETREYAHAAAVMVLTPQGRVSRYLYGVVYDPQTIRLSLVEAADGKIGSSLDQVLLYCFHYDEQKGRYGTAATTVVRVGGVLTLLGIGCMVFFFRRRSAPSRPAEGDVASDAVEPQQTETVG